MALVLAVLVRNADHVVVLMHCDAHTGVSMCNVNCVVVLMHRGAHTGYFSPQRCSCYFVDSPWRSH